MSFEARLAFLDRDGTLIRHIPYLCRPEQVELLPGTIEGLTGLRQMGFRLVLASNQSGVGRGYFGMDDVEAVHRRLQALLEGGGVGLDLLLYCPHAPDAGCRCRKPGPEMAQRAQRQLGLGLEGAIMVGDSDCDMEFARGLGISGYRLGTPELLTLDRLPALLKTSNR